MSSSVTVVADWPHRWYGFWRSNDSETQLPLLEEVADADWSQIDIAKIVSYLNGSPKILAASGQAGKCLGCEEIVSNGLYRSDGTWLWPDDLSHYVEKHKVALPPAFIQHISDRQFLPPAECFTPVEKLPWP